MSRECHKGVLRLSMSRQGSQIGEVWEGPSPGSDLVRVEDSSAVRMTYPGRSRLTVRRARRCLG